ncbi:MAG: ATP-dependent RecD-like DNA helicase [Clostridia bacterium]|nr:ATP-dependent RecD-like DNA helicase [Clostridia bacterium]
MSELYLDGVVEDVVFTNKENGYTVCTINSHGEPVTLVGIMPYVGEGESIKVQGEWQVHSTFGRQFKVSYFEKKLPTTSAAILRYLSSGAIKGIGPVTAERMVERFGEDTLDVIENNPGWLSDIRGISPKRAEEIHNSYVEQFGMRSVMMFCNEFFGAALSVRIFKTYGSAAIDIIKQTPYRLCDEVQGIGFEKADEVARQLGFSPDCPERVEAGLVHVLNRAAMNGGHCYLPQETLVSAAEKILGVGEDDILSAVKRLETAARAKTFEGPDGQCCALAELYSAEAYIAAKLHTLANFKFPYLLEGMEEQIALLERKFGIEYAPEQREAIGYAFSGGVTVVTGGPGTGKTTIIKAILEICNILKFSCVLAAPTGRAAQRMYESSGREAKTVHRLLEASVDASGGHRFARDDENPLSQKVIIIDEMSMVDTYLLCALLRAVKTGSYLILIGDPDQLPPVGPGDCLNDIINSGLYNVVKLNKIFRQAEQSLIVQNAHAVNRGEMPVLNRRDNDFFFVEKNDNAAIAELLTQLVCTRLPQRYGADPWEEIQVITGTRKSVLGTAELNAAFQQALNPPARNKAEKKYGSVIFREGDKVMQIKNDYDLLWKRGAEEGSGVFNGDIGRITDINTRAESFSVDFDGRIAEYDFSQLEELELAYAVTVHKSQGSEYRIIVIPMFEAPAPLMNRKLLYTAITRARELAIIVGSRSALARMVANGHVARRYTALQAMLEAAERL